MPDKKSRATSLTDLQSRLERICKAKKKLSYKDKLIKKKLKNTIKKKSKRDNRKQSKRVKSDIKNELNTDLEINDRDKNQPPEETERMSFSKIDFAQLGKKTKKKTEKDPKKILENMQKENEKLKKLEESGKAEEVSKMKEKKLWKNALAKAQGEKVKDDPELLKKSLKKREQKVRSSRKKWEARMEKVEKQKEERQKKRTENIMKKKKEKKTHKLKKAVKKGKIIPGY